MRQSRAIFFQSERCSLMNYSLKFFSSLPPTLAVVHSCSRKINAIRQLVEHSSVTVESAGLRSGSRTRNESCCDERPTAVVHVHLTNISPKLSPQYTSRSRSLFVSFSVSLSVVLSLSRCCALFFVFLSKAVLVEGLRAVVLDDATMAAKNHSGLFGTTGTCPVIHKKPAETTPPVSRVCLRVGFATDTGTYCVFMSTRRRTRTKNERWEVEEG